MEQLTMEDFETGIWKIHKFVLPNASEYLIDVDNIVHAATSYVYASETNEFFNEACQMIVNSMYLFQEGFFDAAFYSLRQSIETSIGTLYLTANPDKMAAWENLESGFESGTMARFLQKHEPVFREMRNKMSLFFNDIYNIKRKTNKYVHKQGFASFYTSQHTSWSDHREEKIYNKIVSDFERTLKAAIGAVAVYRLAIDPLPVILMDEELMKRSGDFITEPYSERFVNKYIGFENLELYKQTEFYQSYKKHLMSQEKQNEAVFEIIHWRIIERNSFDDISKQIHLLSVEDRLAVVIIMSSIKIPLVYIYGCILYCSDVKPLSTDIVLGDSYFDDFFVNSNNFNVPFKENSYISRIRIFKKYSYIESNEMLDNSEIASLNYIAKTFEEAYKKQEKEFQDLITEYKDEIANFRKSNKNK